MKVVSSQSGGSAPAPGWGWPGFWWNMPRISAVALKAAPLDSVASDMLRAAGRTAWASARPAACVSRTKKPRWRRASTRPWACSRS